jgi:crossover junction endodeoxyribonuclease RuvC
VRILGIDPGIAITGWGVLDVGAKSINDLKLRDYGVIRTAKELAHGERLREIYDDMKEIIERFDPEVIAVEKLYFCNNAKTAISVGEARGIVLLAATEANLRLFEFTPLEIKDSVCGYGKADKKQVQKMVASILSMQEIPKPDDAADGLAVAICCSSACKFDDKLNSNIVDK